MILRMVLAVILSIASPAAAQVTAPAVAEAPDPARLAAAREVVDLSFPPTMRKSMVDQVATSILKNAQRGVEGSAEFKKMISDPRAVAIFDQYLAKRQTWITGLAQESVPTMFEAYSRAYARQFTLAQLAELKAFFQTSTGQLYASRSVSLLSDPDVATAMQQIGVRAMQSVGNDRETMIAEIRALPSVKR